MRHSTAHHVTVERVCRAIQEGCSRTGDANPSGAAPHQLPISFTRRRRELSKRCSKLFEGNNDKTLALRVEFFQYSNSCTLCRRDSIDGLGGFDRTTFVRVRHINSDIAHVGLLLDESMNLMLVVVTQQAVNAGSGVVE
jgi:hypothetical protein